MRIIVQLVLSFGIVWALCALSACISMDKQTAYKAIYGVK